ncbi:MAG: hypothetical protein NWE89_12650 [Candidatus Bathyarchaeota archaeon]|nr:hypothetical protein [Candidatus Bathyarchaeota archaeon]
MVPIPLEESGISSKSKRPRKKRGSGKKSKTWKIPSNVLTIGVVLFCLFIVSGGFYNILEKPPAVLPVGNTFITLHPYFTDQTVYESVFVFLTNGAAFIGLWLSYKATQVVYDKDKANRYLVFGIGFALLGVSGLYLIINMKRAILG